MTDLEMLRKEIARLIECSPESDGAFVHAADLIDGADLSSMPLLRIAILRSFTIEPLIEVLKVRLFLEGFRLDLFMSEFNQYEQEIVDPSSRLYRFNPQLTFVAVRLEEMCPSLFNEYARLMPEDVEGIQEEILERIAGWVQCLSQRGSMNILLSNFLVPMIGVRGLCDTQEVASQVSVLRALNAKLVQLREQFAQLYIFDLELLAGNIGKRRFCDPLQLVRMSNPYSLSAYPAYGEHVATHILALLGRRRKCLILDLDGTLWGGVLGEEGMDGVELSDVYPGNCFKEFQRALWRLYDQGIILAVNSKNNFEDAMQMIRSHPEMVLKEDHFSAVRINWRDKVENLYDIARELRLGLDAFVFMDDSPAECERVRQACPDVLVVQLPGQPHLYRSLLESLRCFEQLNLSAEDRVRGELYRTESKREKLRAQVKTLEEFYASLDMQGQLYRNERSHVVRIAQLTQKTNQFNLTTKRFTEADVMRFMEEALVYSLEISDKFGDNGIICVAIVIPSDQKGEWVIDTFLMSCRVMMRTIEDTLVACIAEDAREAGVRNLVGLYQPSDRNQVVKNFYKERGFSFGSKDASGQAQYVLDLTSGGMLKASPWIALREQVRLRQ